MAFNVSLKAPIFNKILSKMTERKHIKIRYDNEALTVESELDAILNKIHFTHR